MAISHKNWHEKKYFFIFSWYVVNPCLRRKQIYVLHISGFSARKRFYDIIKTDWIYKFSFNGNHRQTQSFSCLRPDRNIFLTLDNVENDRSPSQFVTGRVRNILSAIIHVRKCCCQSKFPNNFKFWGVISSFFTNISKCVSSDFIVSSMSTGYSLMSLFAFSSSSFCTFLEMKLCRGF